MLKLDDLPDELILLIYDIYANNREWTALGSLILLSTRFLQIYKCNWKRYDKYQWGEKFNQIYKELSIIIDHTKSKNANFRLALINKKMKKCLTTHSQDIYVMHDYPEISHLDLDIYGKTEKEFTYYQNIINDDDDDGGELHVSFIPRIHYITHKSKIIWIPLIGPKLLIHRFLINCDFEYNNTNVYTKIIYQFQHIYSIE